MKIFVWWCWYMIITSASCLRISQNPFLNPSSKHLHHSLPSFPSDLYLHVFFLISFSVFFALDLYVCLYLSILYYLPHVTAIWCSTVFLVDKIGTRCSLLAVFCLKVEASEMPFSSPRLQRVVNWVTVAVGCFFVFVFCFAPFCVALEIVVRENPRRFRNATVTEITFSPHSDVFM